MIGVQDLLQEKCWGRRELTSLSPAWTACMLKGGYLSITTHGLLLALQPSPPGLDPRHRDLSYQQRLSSLEGRDLRT